jgi:hypothetical protein
MGKFCSHITHGCGHGCPGVDGQDTGLLPYPALNNKYLSIFTIWVLISAIIYSTVFRGVTSCGPVDNYQGFWGNRCPFFRVEIFCRKWLLFPPKRWQLFPRLTRHPIPDESNDSFNIQYLVFILCVFFKSLFYGLLLAFRFWDTSLLFMPNWFQKLECFEHTAIEVKYRMSFQARNQRISSE